MPAPVLAAFAGAARAGAQVAARAGAAAGRATATGAKATGKAVARGARGAAVRSAQMAKAGARRGGRTAAKSAGGVARHAGSKAGGKATSAARGVRPQLPSRSGWNYQRPANAKANADTAASRPGAARGGVDAPVGRSIDPAATAKKFLSNRLKRTASRRVFRKRRKKKRKAKDKAREKVRKVRRRLRRTVVLSLALLLLFPLVVGGIGTAQMNDAMAASQDDVEDGGFGRLSGIPYADEFNKTAALGIDPRLVAAVAWAESSFDPDVVYCRRTSSKGARGIMQLMPGTARELNVDACKPPQGIDGGARYLLQQHQKFRTWELALAAYNAGPGKVEAAGNKIPDIAETKAYVPKVMGKWEDYKRQFPGGSISGGAPDGPLGGTERYVDSHNTARMQRVLDEIIERFGRGMGVGCWRWPDDGGDHPDGKACDFMMAKIGQRPTEQYQAHGTAMAEWLIANADELGIKYIIWEKRIWESHIGEWRPYTRYGNSTNLTLQHYDHVHVSVK